jgi:hypothetical protein
MVSRELKGLVTGFIEIVTGEDECFCWMVYKDGTFPWALVEKFENSKRNTICLISQNTATKRYEPWQRQA